MIVNGWIDDEDSSDIKYITQIDPYKLLHSNTMLCAPFPQSLQLIIALSKLEDDLRYEGESWQDQTHSQDDQGQDEMLHSEWLKWLLFSFFFEWNFVDHQTSLELKM